MATASASQLDYRPSYTAAGIVSAAVLLLYIITLAPSTAMWDTSEYIAAAYTLGLPHPPGNPMFVLIGRVFAVLPFAPNVAMRINILAALSSAVSAGAWFLITERVLVGWFPKRSYRVIGGALAAAIGATAFTVWNQSVVNEKVYTVSLAGIAIISWLMIRWADEPDGKKADRTLLLVAYLLGLGYSVHMGGMLAAPAVAAVVLVRRPRTLLRWPLLLGAAGIMLFGLTPFAIQPIRAAYNPAINEGEPTACRDGLKVSCTFSKGTKDAFMYNFNRGQYGKPPLTVRQAPFTAQVGMWWLYFKWQWLRDPYVKNPGTQSILAAVFLVLGLFGGWVHFQRDRQSFWYFGPFVFSTTLLLIYYLNFKYGASQAPELGSTVEREVRDRDYFYLWSFSAWGVWAALGLVFIWESIASLFGTTTAKLGRDDVVLPTDRGWKLASPVLAIALIPLLVNWTWASRAGETDTRDFAHDLLNSVEPYGVLVTVGDNDTFPLWYAQEVEGIRKDVVVANTSLLNTDWYVRQLIRRPVYDYDAAKGPAVYRTTNWQKPASGPLKMSMEEADSIPSYYQLNSPQQFTLGQVSVTIDPRSLEQGVLQRADVFVLRMIQDAFPARPIYFSRTSGSYARSLGLTDHTLTQGLADKLITPPTDAAAKASRDTIYLQGEGWFDVKRTKVLWDSVYLGPAALIKKDKWTDRPSIGIPYLYVATGLLGLVPALQYLGDDAGARAVHKKAVDVVHAVRLESWLSSEALRYQQMITPLADSAAVPMGDTAKKTSLPARKKGG
jgi:hypothetical protein